MRDLPRDQRVVLAEFFGNFAVAWLAAGLIVPLLTNDFTSKSLSGMVMSLAWTSILLSLMIYLTKKGKK